MPVILITAWASISLAVEGMKKGAFDFVSKPWDNADIIKTLLTSYFLKNLKNIYDTDEVVINNTTLKWLQNLSFPGNIREIKNLVERTWLLTGKKELEISDFKKALEQSINKFRNNNFPEPGTMTMDEIEEEMIKKTLCFLD